MTLRAMNLSEKIAGVERVIQSIPPNAPGADALREVAKDLRARPSAGRALVDLQRVMRAAARARRQDGRYPENHVLHAFQMLVRHWNLVEQALEEHEAREALR